MIGATLAEVFAREEQPDPFPVSSLLRLAVTHARRGGASEADIARAAGLTPPALSRALRNDNARPSTVRAVLRVAGMRLALITSEVP